MAQAKIERLIALLHAQRDEAARHARQVRGSSDWVDSSKRLDTLNDQIMQVGSGGPTASDAGDAAAGLGRTTRMVGRRD